MDFFSISNGFLLNFCWISAGFLVDFCQMFVLLLRQCLSSVPAGFGFENVFLYLNHFVGGKING